MPQTDLEITVAVSSSRGDAVHEPVKLPVKRGGDEPLALPPVCAGSALRLPSPSGSLWPWPTQCVLLLRPIRHPLALYQPPPLSFSLHPLCMMGLQGPSSQGWLKTTLTMPPICAMTANTRQEMTPPPTADSFRRQFSTLPRATALMQATPLASALRRTTTSYAHVNTSHVLTRTEGLGNIGTPKNTFCSGASLHSPHGKNTSEAFDPYKSSLPRNHPLRDSANSSASLTALSSVHSQSLCLGQIPRE